jgi:hypothetical protein
MFLCHGFLGYFAGAAIICFGLSWLYWGREIRRDVNNTLPENQRVDWGLMEKGPGLLMHRIWSDHTRLFPASRKRTYAAISIVLFFLVPIATIITCILLPNTF